MLDVDRWQEIGQVLRLPAELPEPGMVFQNGDPATLKGAAWQAKREIGTRRGALARRRSSPDTDLG